jgi:hypothetical protein
LRLFNDAPISADDAGVLMAYGFKEAASEEFEEVLVKHDDASSEEPWTLLETKLFDADQIAATGRFSRTRTWARMRASRATRCAPKKLARALPEGRMEEVLHQHFVTGLLPHMRKDAALVPGLYDQVVSRMVCSRNVDSNSRSLIPMTRYVTRCSQVGKN